MRANAHFCAKKIGGSAHVRVTMLPLGTGVLQHYSVHVYKNCTVCMTICTLCVARKALSVMLFCIDDRAALRVIRTSD